MDAFQFITGGDAEEIIGVLSKARCPSCGGTGERDDAEPGDIGFKTWACEPCEGKGWNLQAVREIIAAAQ